MGTIWRYGVRCVGIKKRCRKEERHIGGDRLCSIGETTGEPDEAEAKRLALEWIANNMKSVRKAYATAARWEEASHGLIETQPFTPEWNKAWELPV